MAEKKMTQRCKTDKVLGNENWENYMWPHQIDKGSAPPALAQSGQSGPVNSNNHTEGDTTLKYAVNKSGNGNTITHTQCTLF